MKLAVILAGGKGTRLRPYTIALPKPLVPVGERPILEIIIQQLVDSGFTDVNMAVNHQADILRAYFGDGSKWGIKIHYFLESFPMGTMGPLSLMDNLPDNFLVMNGDVLSDIDYGKFLAEHVINKAIFTISGYKREQKIDYGVLDVEEGRLLDFQEKPELHYNVSMGLYAVNKSVVQMIPKSTFYGFDSLMRDMLESKQPVSVVNYDGYWLDIGRPEDYEKASDDIVAGVIRV